MYAFNGIGVMVDWTGEMRTYKRRDTYIHARYSLEDWDGGHQDSWVYSGLLCIAMFINGFCFLLFFYSLFSFIVYTQIPVRPR